MIFIDTGAFLARYVAADQYHLRATRAWKRLAVSRERCLTSNFVLDETFTLLARRTRHAFAAARARNVYQSEVITVLRPGEEEELRAIEDFEKYGDQGVSFTDCVSFALMRKAGLERVFSFDRHFSHAGFTVWP